MVTKPRHEDLTDIKVNTLSKFFKTIDEYEVVDHTSIEAIIPLIIQEWDDQLYEQGEKLYSIDSLLSEQESKLRQTISSEVEPFQFERLSSQLADVTNARTEISQQFDTRDDEDIVS